MVENSYLETCIQKAGIPGFSGCIEHTSVINQLIKEVKKDKKNFAVWLDLANAYGSMPLKLIEAAMELYHVHVLEKVQGVVRSFIKGMKIRLRLMTTPHTISPILFVMGKGTRATKRETRRSMMDSGIYQPPIRGFMDDLTVTTTNYIQARLVLSALEESVSWARMKFKVKKSRYLVQRKGRVDKRVKRQILGEEILSIVGNSVK